MGPSSLTEFHDPLNLGPPGPNAFKSRFNLSTLLSFENTNFWKYRKMTHHKTSNIMSIMIILLIESHISHWIWKVKLVEAYR